MELARNIDKATRLKNNADSLLALFNNPTQTSSQQLTHLARRISGYSTYDPSNGALNNLISSGQLNLIKNVSLRIILSKWFGEVQDVKEDEVRLIKFGDDNLDPIRLKFINYKDDSIFDRNTFALLNNPEFENVVLSMLSAVKYIIENYKILDLEIEKIIMLIDLEIKTQND